MKLIRAEPQSCRLVIAIVLAALATLGSDAVAVAGIDHLCVAPVPDVDENGQASHGANQPWHRISRVESFPGSRWPVMLSMGHGSVRFDEQRRFRRVVKEFPSNSFWDRFTVDGAGRVIGVSQFHDTVFVQDPADGTFRSLETRPFERVKNPRSVVWSKAFEGTLIATPEGILLLRDAHLDVAQGLRDLTIGRLIDLPRHRAVAHVSDRGLTILYPGGARRGIAALDLREHNFISGIVELDDGLLLTASGETFFVPMQEEAGMRVPGRTQRLSTISRGSGRAPDWYLGPVEKYLIYGTETGRGPRGENMLWHLEGRKVVPIAASQALPWGYGMFVRALTSRQVAVVSGGEIYRYDGSRPPKRMTADQPPGDHGWMVVHDLAGMGIDVAQGRQSLGEIVADDRIVPIKLPPELEGASIQWVHDLPASSAAAIFTDRGIFAMDASRVVARVRGGDIDSSLLHWHLPGRGELLLTTRKGPYLVLDERIAGPDACDRGG